MEYLFRQKDVYHESTALIRFQADSVYDIITKFREFMLASGYHLNVVNEYVPDPDDIEGCCPNHDLDDEDPFGNVRPAE